MDGASSEARAFGPGVTSFTLKVVAIVCMAANHFAYIFEGHLPFPAFCAFVCVGGVTFPIMAFLVTEGYRYTSNVRRYALRLLVFALVSQVPYWVFLMHDANVLFTLCLSLGVIWYYDRTKGAPRFWLAFIGAFALATVCNWGILGVPMMLVAHVYAQQGWRRTVFPVLIPAVCAGVPSLLGMVGSGSLEALPDVLFLTVGCSAAMPLLLAYNGKRGKPLKWAFYVFYPAHIIVLGVACGLLFGEWGAA